MLDAVRPARWFAPFDERPNARVRLYCLPFAGGGAPAYQPWLAHLPSSVRLRAVQLPGRLNRIAEPPLTSLGEVVSAVADALAEDGDELPYALFGHSMGALLAFELTRELRRRDAPAPALLAVSGWPAPDTGPAHLAVTGPLSGLPDDRFLEVLAKLGGLPEEALAEPELVELMIPSLRADFRIIEGYQYRPQAPLSVPVSVFGGTEDPLASAERLRGWARETTGAVRVRRFPGNHFYLAPQLPAVVGALSEDLAGLTGRR
ncbi:alpha/beta fold hydrolase [Streptomyces capparidis]